jgi:hypothetical protein
MPRVQDCRIVLIVKDRPSAGAFGDTVTQADEAHRAERESRHWVADGLCFLLGMGFTALVFLDGTDRQLPTFPLAVDVALGTLASLGCGFAGAGRSAWQ